MAKKDTCTCEICGLETEVISLEEITFEGKLVDMVLCDDCYEKYREPIRPHTCKKCGLETMMIITKGRDLEGTMVDMWLCNDCYEKYYPSA
jgi:hypothetical protein